MSLLICYGFLFPNPLSSETWEGVVRDASCTGIAFELNVWHMKSSRLNRRKARILSAVSSFHYVKAGCTSRTSTLRTARHAQHAAHSTPRTAPIAWRSGVAHSWPWGYVLLILINTANQAATGNHCHLYKSAFTYYQLTPWRNGSASDSRSEGCVFESRRGQIHFFLPFSSFFYSDRTENALQVQTRRQRDT